jgi:hypothetical protein
MRSFITGIVGINIRGKFPLQKGVYKAAYKYFSTHVSKIYNKHDN